MRASHPCCNTRSASEPAALLFQRFSSPGQDVNTGRNTTPLAPAALTRPLRAAARMMCLMPSAFMSDVNIIWITSTTRPPGTEMRKYCEMGESAAASSGTAATNSGTAGGRSEAGGQSEAPGASLGTCAMTAERLRKQQVTLRAALGDAYA